MLRHFVSAPGRLLVVGIATLVLSACGGTDSIDPLASGASFNHHNTPPSQPTSLATPEPVVTVDGSSVTVSWAPVARADEYQVVSTATGIHTPKTSATSVTATVANGTYTVKVRARTTSTNNESGFSKDVTFTVAVAVVEPVTPSDDTPPVIAGPFITGTLGNNGWYTSDVQVTWTATDEESPVTLSGCSVSILENTAGSSFTCTATSEGGSATSSVTIKRDASAPSVSENLAGTMGNNGWYRSIVGVSFDVAANGPSGIGSTSGCAAQSVTADGAFSFTCSATSGAGLSASATGAGKKDSTVPAVWFSGNAGSYTVDQVVAIACATTDAMSGVATKVCPSASGDAYLFNIGSNVLTGSATDYAGNVGNAVTSFTVSVTAGGMCNLVRRFVAHPGIANSLCVKLNAAAAAEARGNLAAEAGALNAFTQEVKAQTGKHITAANATILLRLVAYL